MPRCNLTDLDLTSFCGFKKQTKKLTLTGKKIKKALILGCIEIRPDVTFVVDPRSTRVVVPPTHKSSSSLLNVQSYEMFSLFKP